jgi:UDP:flavonoid glycosyltransferase YjiC (YdhE family)
MRSCVFYISGHGFGHSIRQIEIINALRAAAPEAHIAVRTSAAPWLFTRNVRGPIVLLPGETDTGVVQIDSLRLDERATIELAAAFYGELPRRVDEERAVLERHQAELVIGDAPPLACAAAHACGIPSIVCGNFTWDWIYREYRDASPGAPLLIARLQEIYALAAAAWRLPMHGGFETIGTVLDVPLVARHPTPGRTRASVRAELGLPEDAKLALVSFGGYGVRELPLDRLDCTGDWLVVMTEREPAPEAAGQGVVAIPEPLIYARGLGYPDLIAAVDAVISKPGYGIISDCAGARTPLLYTSRGRFAEYDVLVRDMPQLLRCRYIPLDDFLAGRWREALNALAESPDPPGPRRTDGAATIAGMVLEAAGG